MQSYFERLCDERPRDINLPVVVGASEGELIFYEIPETGLSTLDDTFIHIYRSAGRTVIEKQVQTLPLKQVLEEYVRGPIHFLKIDVEGFEKSVLEGLDLSVWRPWIVVVEATIPGSEKPNYHAWEPLITTQNYSHVYFDGLNRYYLANEYPEIAQAFAAPPNVFDGFITSEHYYANLEIERQKAHAILQQTELISIRNDLEKKHKGVEVLRTEVEWARTELGYLRNEIGRIRSEDCSLRTKLDETQSESDALRAQIENIQTELATKESILSKVKDAFVKAQAELESKRQEVENFKREYHNIYYSKSYRITAPLRAFYGWNQNIRGAIRRIIHRSSVQANYLGKEEGSSIPGQSNHSAEFTAIEQHFLHLFQREMARRGRTKVGNIQ
jgi:FkbM family methyltransferase